MPVNTQLAIDDIRSARNRGISTASNQVNNLASGAGDAVAAQEIISQRQAQLSGAGDTAAAERFIAERDARLSGAGDAAAAEAIIADRTNNTPSPSTVQNTTGAPTGSTSPSLAGRTNSTFTTISPRPYFRIDPLDNRYDFLTGQKINTIRGNPNVAAPPLAHPSGGNTGSGGGTGAGGSQGSTEVTNQTFYNDFGDPYTQADIDAVEDFRRFNEELGGGAARTQLTAGERAYAIQQGYLSSNTTDAAQRFADSR